MLFASNIYSARRDRLSKAIASGIIIIPGNELAPKNYPSGCYPFRQDSSFRYLFGLNAPSLWGVIDADTDKHILFGAETTMEDIIWSGELPSLSARAASVGIEVSHHIDELDIFISRALSLGRKIHILPPYRAETKIALAGLFKCQISELKKFHSQALIEALALMREVKSEEEIAEMERAQEIGYKMHTAAMKLCRAGRREHEISGALTGIAHRYGAGLSFETICSQDGQILHNISQGGTLKDGRLVLVDAGAESLGGYASDNTRTFPVSGRFSPLQRDIYNIVLAAHNNTKTIAQAGILYQNLHAACYRLLADGLRDLSLVCGSIDEIIDSGAMKLFMPHGLSHGVGLDVHDCEAFGERSGVTTSSECCINRKAWRLRNGSVISNEPGIYFIQPLIERSCREGLYKGIVDYARLSSLYNFGGVRIEDVLVITDGGCYELGAKNPIPKSVEQIENFMQNRAL